MDFNLSNLPTRSKSEEEHVKVLILGSGPAGLSAALYVARASLNPVVLSGIEIGGQISLTYSIENYPGFPDGIGGMELYELFQKQAERFGARIEIDIADEVDLSDRPFRVKTQNGKLYLAESLIISTGASAITLNVPGEKEFTGKGVSYCGTCDGWFFKGKDVVVVGGGDSALEEGIFLTRFANSVTIVHRRDQLRAGPILQERARNNPKIDFVWNKIVTEVTGNGSVQSVQLRDTITGEESEQDTNGLFVFIGHKPNTQLFEGQLDMDELGYLIVDQKMRTNVAGVFAAGEVADPHFRQVITSAGMGAAAAMEAGHFLDEIVGYNR
ncbi:MAG: thioredoxin-disulfide reductase [Anaerolineales bacterium]|nr:thioredoxin-disulfide reductase [Anaerolineales bacterium]